MSKTTARPLQCLAPAQSPPPPPHPPAHRPPPPTAPNARPDAKTPKVHKLRAQRGIAAAQTHPRLTAEGCFSRDSSPPKAARNEGGEVDPDLAGGGAGSSPTLTPGCSPPPRGHNRPDRHSAGRPAPTGLGERAIL